MLFKYALMIFTFLLCCSCLKQSEGITPLAPVKTLAELQREAMVETANRAGNSELSAEARSYLELASDPSIFYLHVKYNLKNIDVFEMANMPNSFEAIGHSFLQTLARLVLAIGGPREININDIQLNIPDFHLDRSIIKSIKIKRIFLTYNHDLDIESDYAADFSFIETLELSRLVTVPKLGAVNTLFLSYRKNHNMCLYKCLQFEILEDNIIDILRPNTNVLLRPALTIKSLPAVNDLRLDGQIEMQIGLRLPF